jgi:hypothetical protein
MMYLPNVGEPNRFGIWNHSSNRISTTIFLHPFVGSRYSTQCSNPIDHRIQYSYVRGFPVEMFQTSAIVLTRTVPSTTVSLPASSLTTLLTLTKSSDLNVVTTLDYSYQSSQTSWSYQIDLAS